MTTFDDMNTFKDMILTQRITINKIPKSAAKFWSMVDSFPVEVELSFNMSTVERGYTNPIKITNLDNKKSWTSSALSIKGLLYFVDYEVRK